MRTIIKQGEEILATVNGADAAIRFCEQYFQSNLEQNQRSIKRSLKNIGDAHVWSCLGGSGFLTIENPKNAKRFLYELALFDGETEQTETTIETEQTETETEQTETTIETEQTETEQTEQTETTIETEQTDIAKFLDLVADVIATMEPADDTA